MGADLYGTAHVERRVGVRSSTLRDWCDRYAEFLSDGAHPAPGVRRSFSAADLVVLQSIQQLRANGLTAEQVAARLRADGADTLRNGADGVRSAAAGTAIATTPAAGGELAPAAGSAADVLAIMAAIERRPGWGVVLAVGIAAFGAGVALGVAIMAAVLLTR